MDISTLIISSHIARDHHERCKRINQVLKGDWGEVICQINQNNHIILGITNTGLCIIVDEGQQRLITCYLLHYTKAKNIFAKANIHMPMKLIKTIQRNERIYYKLYKEYM